MKLIKKLNEKAIIAISELKNEDGQSTAEYSLVIVGAAAVATLLINWASGSGAIGNLFEKVIHSIF